MKKFWLIGLVILGVTLLSVLLIVPIFAQGPLLTDKEWEDMYQACQSGDWDAMGYWHQRMHGDGTGYGACHGGSGAPGQGRVTYGGGMMGGGGGMMTW